MLFNVVQNILVYHPDLSTILGRCHNAGVLCFRYQIKVTLPTMDSAGDKTPTDVSTEKVSAENPTSSDIVQKYQEMFSSRYSDDDPFFKPYKTKGMDPPPIMENYFIRQQKRSWNDSYQDHRNNQDRGYGPSKRPQYDHRGQHGGHHGGHHRERDGGWGQQGRNQQWGNSSHNQDWRQRDRQGQGSQPQRGQRERYSDGRHDRWSNERPNERQQDTQHRSQGRNSSHKTHDEWT
ncbi:uncharacterized protein LOC117287798 isoform X2 [Asterias rubens]|uniref:uncharacterized protein LOC117287798 isoform X2 n=1 Tax=Asterias rubens TaxID=7604 RepID=UPI00145566E4|nr:uncharacterized protein LOC117287798 isoform X2 [Asterias rubens]